MPTIFRMVRWGVVPTVVLLGGLVAVAPFQSFDEPRVRAAAGAFDLNGNGRLDVDGVVELARVVGG